MNQLAINGGLRMNYTEFNALYKNNEFRKIDAQKNARKFYLLRCISKSKTLNNFCEEKNLNPNLNELLADEKVTEEVIVEYIRKSFKPKSNIEIKQIEAELNKMQNFDWGGSMGNSLEKNIVNNFIKKMPKYDEINDALSGNILKSVYGYTMNSWYNHWSSIMIEEIFNENENVLPTIDLVEKIDFFIGNTPYDLKVTYFPEELMKNRIGEKLFDLYGSKSELTCTKKIAKEIGLAIPSDLKGRALTICLQNLLRESLDDRAKEFIRNINNIKKEIVNFYQENPNELIIWLYENQGEMRFDAANRFFVVLVDSDNPFDSWKLKRNVNLLKDKIATKIDTIIGKTPNFIDFYWKKDSKNYSCISEILFISK